MKKKALALFLSTAMCASLFAGCGNSETGDEADTVTEAVADVAAADTEEAPVESNDSEDPIESLPGSIYYFGYEVEGLGTMVQFFHFYPDDLGIGQVFYAGYAWNQITFSGTYTVEEASFDYEVLTEYQNEETITGTAPYTITFYDWDGNVLDQAGYDGEYVYNTTDNVNCDAMTGGGHYRQSKADETALADYADTFDGELGIAYLTFVSPDDESATVTLNTNGSYNDMAIFAVDGTWSVSGDTYTLTPDSDSDNGATLSLQEDGTYTYVSTDGTELTMSLSTAAAVAYTFAGTFDLAGMEATLTINAYDDGTCDAIAGMSGVEMPVDQGTWSADESFTFTFEFDNAGECVSEFGGDTGVQVNYSQSGVEAIGGGDITATCPVVL
jgi:hypothetical protein